MGHLHTSSDHLAGVHHRAAPQSNQAFGLGFQGGLATIFNEGDGGFGVDFVKNSLTHAGFVQSFRDGLFIAETTEGLVGHQKHLLVAALAADFANLSARCMAFNYFRLRKGDVVDHFAGQTVDLFSEEIGVHG